MAGLVIWLFSLTLIVHMLVSQNVLAYIEISHD
jgi:hypothetical protein